MQIVTYKIIARYLEASVDSTLELNFDFGKLIQSMCKYTDELIVEPMKLSDTDYLMVESLLKIFIAARQHVQWFVKDPTTQLSRIGWFIRLANHIVEPALYQLIRYELLDAVLKHTESFAYCPLEVDVWLDAMCTHNQR